MDNTMYFVAQIFPALVVGNFFQLISSCVLWIYSLGSVFVISFCFLSAFLLSGTKRCPRLILYILYPNPSISYFFKELFFFFLLEDYVRNQDLGTSFTHCYRDVVAFVPSQLPEQDIWCLHNF